MTRQKREDASVKIDAAIVRRARMIAAYRDITIAEYLSELLDKPTAKDYESLKRQICREGEGHE